METKTPKHSDKRKADTDCWNDAFEQFLIQQARKIYPDVQKSAALAKSTNIEGEAMQAKTEVLELPGEPKGRFSSTVAKSCNTLNFKKRKCGSASAK